MTIELIRQARERLEQLRDESTQGEWVGSTIFTGLPFAPKIEGYSIRASGELVVEGSSLSDSELIVTLHRTLDAQIQILKDASEYKFESNIPLGAILVAKAIMGVE